MPQMMPMNWLNIMMCMNIFTLLLMSFLFFINQKKMKLKPTSKSKKKLNFMW